MRQLSDAERAKAPILPPDTLTLLLEQVAALTDFLCSVSFPGAPEQREEVILAFVEAQAKRNTLLSLITDSENARAQLTSGEL